jgi:mono/diheme cytochrome c family protein
MCAVSWYQEEDPDAPAAFADLPSLADALAAVGPGPTWCSNPYVEHGRNNARTNCVGCHQHGGATVAHDLNADGLPDAFDLEKVINDDAHFPQTGRAQIRTVFPADYTYSFNRVDDLSHVIRSEIAHFEHTDADAALPRVRAVLALTGDADRGATTFGENCAPCHGPAGGGTERAPNLAERVPGREDDALVRTLLQGRGRMPAWGGRFDDATVADLLAFLRRTF